MKQRGIRGSQAQIFFPGPARRLGVRRCQADVRTAKILHIDDGSRQRQVKDLPEQVFDGGLCWIVEVLQRRAVPNVTRPLNQGHFKDQNTVGLKKGRGGPECLLEVRNVFEDVLSNMTIYYMYNTMYILDVYWPVDPVLYFIGLCEKILCMGKSGS